MLLDELNRVTLHASETFSGRSAIQTPFEEFRVGANLPQASEKELAKLRKREEAEEKKARAALAAHQVSFPLPTPLSLYLSPGVLLEVHISRCSWIVSHMYWLICGASTCK